MRVMGRCYWSAVTALMILIGSTSSSWSSASGTYVGKYDNAAIMLQLVETPDHHVTGQLTSFFVDANGTITDGNSSVTGAIDGQAIAFQVRELSLLSTPTN